MADLNFPVIHRTFADAMRTNRRPSELLMPCADWREDDVPAAAVVQPKYDGFRAGYGTSLAPVVTREGVEVRCASHALPELYSLASVLQRLTGAPHLLDMEYTHPDGFEAAIGDLRRGGGAGVLRVFDAVPMPAYHGRDQSPPLLRRLDVLDRAWAAMPTSDVRHVLPAPYTVFRGEARDRIELAAGAAWEQGLEGIVVKDGASPYVRGPSRFWQRIKRRNTVDLPVIRADVVDGRLKAIVVRTAADRECRVGVGFSDALRATPDVFRPGSIVELAHLGVTPSGSLRSPSFLRTRLDKES
jgi:hypothetical protein